MSVYESYMDKKSEYDKNGKLRPMRDDILDQINSAVIKYSQGAQDVLKYQLPNDEFIQESLKYFYSDGQGLDTSTNECGNGSPLILADVDMSGQPRRLISSRVKSS